ncbi:MAG: ABC transporter ATP-binding protein/permease [Armatimonadetes bacterium]|nr:ABC transporter ATP-binding protein/permease [Armatimonadota bacterium]
MDTRNRLLKYLLAYKGRLITAAICGLVMAACSLFTATLVGWFTAACDSNPVWDLWIIKFGLRHGWFIHTDAAAKAALIWIVASLLVLVHIPKGLFGYLNGYVVASVTNRLGTDIRAGIYAHLQSLQLSFFHRSRIGDIMSRLGNDVGLIQNSSLVVTQAIDGPIMIIVGLGKMFALSWKLALLTVFFAPMMGVVIDKLTRKLRPLTTVTQETLADVNATIEESINGVRIIKSFGMEEHEIKRFNKVNTASLIAALRYWRRNALVLPSIEVMGGVAAALIIATGGWMVVKGEITFRILNEFTLLAFMVAAAVKQFGRLNVSYQQTLAASERVFEILDTKSDLIEDPNGAVLKNVQGRVEFRNVCFEYNPGEVVLDDVSFIMHPGEAVAIVGPSGAGKSTIADLIPRFYDVTKGRILVEGQDVRNIKTQSLREQIAMVPQETILFGGTIAENIAYGRPGAPNDEIVEVAKAANAHEFIAQLPRGYDTELGERGVGLSGGQRQRISIARALLKNPKILILDEATSSLDAASEGIVQEALDRLMQGRSTLIIAHRLSTVKNADRVLVMDRGGIVESGAFDDLVASGGLFSQLYRTQFRPEEVV